MTLRARRFVVDEQWLDAHDVDHSKLITKQPVVLARAHVVAQAVQHRAGMSGIRRVIYAVHWDTDGTWDFLGECCDIIEIYEP